MTLQSAVDAAQHVVNDPTVTHVAVGFATLSALYLIRLVLSLNAALFGDRHDKEGGIIAKLNALAKQLGEHCTDERKFWDEVRDGREAIADKAQIAISTSEDRMREHLDSRFDTLAAELRIRREKRKP